MPFTPPPTGARTDPRSALIVDPSPLVCDAIAAVLYATCQPATVQHAHTFAEATRRVPSADLVLTELDVPGGERHDVVPALAANAAPGARIVVVTEQAQGRDVEHAIGAGASGFLLKSTDVRGFHHALDSVVSGSLYLQPELGAMLYGAGTHRQPQHDLEETELRLLALIARGFTNRQSAQRENVSLRTIESRRARLQMKLGCQGRAALTRHAFDLGLAPV
jgi:DNA-binding NarL/FixJ family response regulator